MNLNESFIFQISNNIQLLIYKNHINSDFYLSIERK